MHHVMSQLPRPLSESELILSCTGVAQRDAFRTMLDQINHDCVYQALMWLKGNNVLYSAVSVQDSQMDDQTISSDTLNTDEPTKPENDAKLHVHMHNCRPGGRVQTLLIWWWSYIKIGHFTVFHQYNFHFLEHRLHSSIAISNLFTSMVTSDNLKTQMRSSKTVTKQDIKIQPFNM